jgi:hypothetical protein
VLFAASAPLAPMQQASPIRTAALILFIRTGFDATLGGAVQTYVSSCPVCSSLLAG